MSVRFLGSGEVSGNVNFTRIGMAMNPDREHYDIALCNKAGIMVADIIADHLKNGGLLKNMELVGVEATYSRDYSSECSMSVVFKNKETDKYVEAFLEYHYEFNGECNNFHRCKDNDGLSGYFLAWVYNIDSDGTTLIVSDYLSDRGDLSFDDLLKCYYKYADPDDSEVRNKIELDLDSDTSEYDLYEPKLLRELIPVFMSIYDNTGAGYIK